MDITRQISSIENQIKTYVVNENIDFYNPITWIQRNPGTGLSTITAVISFAGAAKKFFRYIKKYSVALFIDSTVISSDDLHNIIEKIIDNMNPVNLTISDKIIQEKYIPVVFNMEF